MLRTARLLNLRPLARHPVRAVITILAVGAGVSLAIGVFVLSSSTAESLSHFSHQLAGPTQLRVVGATSRGGLDADVLPRVARTPGVGAAIPVVQAVTYAEDGRGGSHTVIAFGVDCSIQALIGPIGCTPADLSRLRETPFVSARLAGRLGAEASIRTDLGRASLGHALAVSALDRLNDGNVVVYALPTAQRLFARAGRLDAIYVQPLRGTDVRSLRRTLQAAVGGWNGVLTAADPPPGAGVATATFVPLFTLLSFFVLAIAAVLVYNTMTLALEERRADLAVIGALGGNARTMVTGVMAEAAVLGLFGGFVGIIGGVALAHPLASTLSDFTTKFAGVPITVHVTVTVIVIGVLLGTVLAAGAAWLPGRRATRMDVAAELSRRDLRAESAPRARVRLLVVFIAVAGAGIGLCWLAQRHGGLDRWQADSAPVGLIVASIGLLLAVNAGAGVLTGAAVRGVPEQPVIGRLGLANLARAPGRTGVMAVAIAAVVAVAFAVASTKASIHAAIAHSVAAESQDEIAVSTISPNNTLNVDAKVSPTLFSRLRATPGVARVDRTEEVLTGHTKSDLVGVEAMDRPRLALPLVEGSKDLADFERGRVLIGAALARTHHVRPGDRLTLDTPTGLGAVTVGGIWLNGNFNGNVVDMPMGLFQRLYGDVPATIVAVVPTPGTGVDELARRLVAANLQPDLQVDTPSQTVARASRDVARQLHTFDALEEGLVVVAFIAVLSTLLLVGVQRRRELGLLAAIGTEPGQLAKMTLAEAVAVAIIGVVLSIGAAVGMTISLNLVVPIVIGYRDPLRFAFASAAFWGPLAVLIALGAAALPSWRSTRVPVLEALQYE